MIKATGFLHSTKELRQLIIDNPDLPLIVFASEDANTGDYAYMTCSKVRANISEYLDCIAPCNDAKAYLDREDFAEDMMECYADDYPDLSDEEFYQHMEAEIAKYDKYWVKCIAVYVDN
jgi:hypothetical protein